ncbi:hypothetical protein BHE74_00053892 [Ensete ventricosum]|nr:hypothetical protein BHE74_00053892 [Ensete ventricosum]
MTPGTPEHNSGGSCELSASSCHVAEGVSHGAWKSYRVVKETCCWGIVCCTDYGMWGMMIIRLLVALVLLARAAAGDSGAELPLGWIPFSPSGCRGTIAECLAGEEFDLGSEAGRRILATSSYISYGALKRDTVPCSRRGASYYNCRPGAQANPYSRSCSAITQCRGG